MHATHARSAAEDIIVLYHDAFRLIAPTVATQRLRLPRCAVAADKRCAQTAADALQNPSAEPCAKEGSERFDAIARRAASMRSARPRSAFAAGADMRRLSSGNADAAALWREAARCRAPDVFGTIMIRTTAAKPPNHDVAFARDAAIIYYFSRFVCCRR